MNQTRRAYSSALKAEVALAAISKINTIAQLSERHVTHRNQIRQWKRRVMTGAQQLFQRGTSLSSDQARQIKVLQAKVSELTKENEFSVIIITVARRGSASSWSAATPSCQWHLNAGR